MNSRKEFSQANLSANPNDFDELMADLMNPTLKFQRFTLFQLFEQRLKDLEINKTSAQEILKIQHRTLQGILHGKQRIVDFASLIRLSEFLQVDRNVVLELFFKELKKNFPDDFTFDEKALFIKRNFDLLSLKKSGYLENITDFEYVEERLIRLYGLKSILDYKPKFDKIFSASRLHTASDITAENFTHLAENIISQIINPNLYSNDNLVDVLVNLRQLNLDTENGFLRAAKQLYSVGVNLIFLSKLPSLHIRGATFWIGRTPCIVVTDYRKFYPTIWFALIHEIYHVLFHEEQIRSRGIHLTQDSDEFKFSEKELDQEADDFSSRYWIPDELFTRLPRFISNHTIIEHLGKENSIHPSFFYAFYAYKYEKGREKYFGLANKFSPSISSIKNHFPSPWDNGSPSIDEIISTLKSRIYVD